MRRDADECRNMEDFVTWVDTSKIKRSVMNYNDEVGGERWPHSLSNTPRSSTTLISSSIHRLVLFIYLHPLSHLPSLCSLLSSVMARRSARASTRSSTAVPAFASDEEDTKMAEESLSVAKAEDDVRVSAPRGMKRDGAHPQTE